MLLNSTPNLLITELPDCPLIIAEISKCSMTALTPPFTSIPPKI
jgi:hypothetical protein